MEALIKIMGSRNHMMEGWGGGNGAILWKLISNRRGMEPYDGDIEPYYVGLVPNDGSVGPMMGVQNQIMGI